MTFLAWLIFIVLAVSAYSDLSRNYANENQVELIVRSDSPLMNLVHNAAGVIFHRFRRSTKAPPCIQTKQWPPPPCLSI